MRSPSAPANKSALFSCSCVARNLLPLSSHWGTLAALIALLGIFWTGRKLNGACYGENHSAGGAITRSPSIRLKCASEVITAAPSFIALAAITRSVPGIVMP